MLQNWVVWSKVLFQARHRSLLQPGPHASLHPPLLIPLPAPPTLTIPLRDSSSQPRRLSPTYHIIIFLPQEPPAPWSCQGHAHRERQGQPPTLLLHNVAINWLENCLSRQKPILGETRAPDIYFVHHLSDKHLLPSGALDAPVTHNN